MIKHLYKIEKERESVCVCVCVTRPHLFTWASQAGKIGDLKLGIVSFSFLPLTYPSLYLFFFFLP